MSSPLRSLLARIPIVVSIFNVYKYFRRFRSQFLPDIKWFASRVEGLEIDEEKRAIIFSPTVNPPIAFVFECLFACKLRERGYDARVLMDTGLFSFPESISIDEKLRLRDFRRMLRYSFRRLRHIPFYMFTDSMPGKTEAKKARALADEMIRSGEYTMDGIDLWPYIEASLVRYTKSALGHWMDQPDADLMKLRYCRNAVWSLSIAKAIIDHIRPELVVISHGIYSTWGPIYKYLTAKGVKVIIYDFGWYKPDGMIFNHSGLIANGSDDGFFGERHPRIDIDKARAFVEGFMSDRLSGIAFDLLKAEPILTTKFSLKQVIEKAAGRKLFALFPNVLWDASNADTDDCFLNWIEWIIESVRFFSQSDDKVLVVRAHPAEKDFMKARITVEDVISRAFGKPVGEIPNIIFIPPNAGFRSYELFPYLKGGLVYNGTLGLEMIYHHVPVFVAGKAAYQGHDFIVKFHSKTEYFNALSNPAAVLAKQEPHIDLLVKYLYTYFWANQSSIRFMNAFWSLPDQALLKQVWDDPQLNFAMDTAIGKHRFFQDWVIPE